MDDYTMVTVTLKVYIPKDVVSQGDDQVEEYLNDKFENDPEFFGYIDQGCFRVTPE